MCGRADRRPTTTCGSDLVLGSNAGPGGQRPGVVYRVQRSAEEWRALLSDEQYQILRDKGTEYPGTGGFNKYYPQEGHFACAGCGQPLYSAASKFDSGCGWPAFDKIVEGSVVTKTDTSLGMSRVEIMCSSCGGHLGHVFGGEGFTPTMERHCVNSAGLQYSPEPLDGDGKEVKVLPPRDKKGVSDILAQLMRTKGE